MRYLRIGEGIGDGFFSIAEFAAFCQTPTPFPPAFRQSDAPLAAVTKRPWYKLDWWEDHASARFEMVLALFGLLILAWGYWHDKTGKDLEISARGPKLTCAISLLIYAAITLALMSTSWVQLVTVRHVLVGDGIPTLLVTPFSGRVFTPLRWLLRQYFARRKSAGGAEGTEAKAFTPAGHVRRQLLVLVGVLSFLAYWNFGAFHFGNYTHVWDTTTITSARSTSRSSPSTGSTSAPPSPTPRIPVCAGVSSCARS